MLYVAGRMEGFYPCGGCPCLPTAYTADQRLIGGSGGGKVRAYVYMRFAHQLQESSASPSKMFWTATDKEGGLNKIASCF